MIPTSIGCVERFKQQTVRAKKVYVCYECGAEIKIDDSYTSIDICKNRGWTHYRCCLSCGEIGKAFSGIGNRAMGYLWEDMEDGVFPKMTIGDVCRLTTYNAKVLLIEMECVEVS